MSFYIQFVSSHTNTTINCLRHYTNDLIMAVYSDTFQVAFQSILDKIVIVGIIVNRYSTSARRNSTLY